MSYCGIGFGQVCPGDEVFDPDIGVCTCPSGTQTTGTVGVCASASAPVPGWGDACPVNIPIVGNFNCMCPAGTAYDAAKNMCTSEAMRIPSAPSSPSRSRTGSANLSRFARSEISTGAAGVAIVAGLGLIYLYAQRSS